MCMPRYKAATATNGMRITAVFFNLLYFLFYGARALAMNSSVVTKYGRL